MPPGRSPGKETFSQAGRNDFQKRSSSLVTLISNDVVVVRIALDEFRWRIRLCHLEPSRRLQYRQSLWRAFLEQAFSPRPGGRGSRCRSEPTDPSNCECHRV